MTLKKNTAQRENTSTSINNERARAHFRTKIVDSELRGRAEDHILRREFEFMKLYWILYLQFVEGIHETALEIGQSRHVNSDRMCLSQLLK